MNRITVCSPAWKRPEVLDIWLRAMLALKPTPFIVVAGSPGDGCEEVAQRYGWDRVFYFQTPNKPVGAKWNEAHKRAKGTAEYYLTTGSDDVLDQKMWDYYQSFTGERLVLMDLYFIDLPSKRALYWGGRPKGMQYENYPIGASQLTRHDVMEKLNWEPFNPKTMAHEMDTERKCVQLGIEQTKIKMVETGGLSIDLKTSDSYSPFRMWPGSTKIELAELREKSPQLMKIILP